MDDLLRRVVVRVVVITMSVVVVPLIAMLVWWARWSTWADGPGERITPTEAIVLLLALTLVVASVAIVAGFAHARRVTRVVLPALNGLVSQSERVEQGLAAKATTPTGVVELDRVGAALGRAAQVAARRLAAERDFAADASHQLRTPLTALLMRLEELAETDDLEVVREESAIAIAQVERLGRVVDDLLARSRSGSAEPDAVSLDSVLAALQQEWQPSFSAARRSVHVTGLRGLQVRASGGALAQILSALFENSLAHGGGTMTLSARRAGPSVIVQVSDQGSGIPPELAARVFERSVSSSGSGLGLALARDLAAAQGGRLELVSAEGAVFALFLSGFDEE